MKSRIVVLADGRRQTVDGEEAPGLSVIDTLAWADAKQEHDARLVGKTLSFANGTRNE